jgi:hypothetical protein
MKDFYSKLKKGADLVKFTKSAPKPSSFSNFITSKYALQYSPLGRDAIFSNKPSKGQDDLHNTFS